MIVEFGDLMNLEKDKLEFGSQHPCESMLSFHTSIKNKI